MYITPKFTIFVWQINSLNSNIMQENKNLTIKQWAEDDRPREKMLSKGASSLSNAELLAILIATGSKTDSALDLAKSLLSKSSNNLDEICKLSPQELSMRVKGIGKAKAVTISAAIELSRRIRSATPVESLICKKSAHIAEEFMRLLSHKKQEEFWIVLFNKANKELARYQISTGTLTRTLVDTRIILKYAIENLATSMILVHNHPSGDLNPSPEDMLLTKNIIACCKQFDILVLDHVIVGNRDFVSFADSCLLE